MVQVFSISSQVKMCIRDRLTHGQTHALGIVACQNVAEVASGHTEVHGIAEGDLAGLEQLLSLIHILIQENLQKPHSCGARY